jgi:hypothetical protein
MHDNISPQTKSQTQIIADNGKVSPQNLDAEAAVLGAILADPKCINEVLEILKPEDFYRVTHAKIFRAMKEVAERREPIDLLVLSDFLKSKNELEAVGGAAYLASCVDSMPTSVNVGHYARLVKKAVQQRMLVNLFREGADRAYSDDPLIVASEVNSHLLRINPPQSVEEHREDSQATFPGGAAWTGLFARWRDVVAPCTEAALENLWSAFLLAAGLAIGRTAWRESPQRLYPNFYLLLIGQTGDSRKSTVLWLASELLERVDIEFNKLTGVASAEAIYTALAEHDGTKALLFNDEFRALLTVGERKTTQNLIPKLNTLYYCPPRDSISRAKVKESTNVIEPFVSLIAATPLAYVDDLLSELHISSGFLNRFLVVTGEEQAPKPIVQQPSTAAWESVTAPLRSILTETQASPRHLEFSPDAEKIWNDFYIKWKTERREWKQKQAELTARIFEHVLKIAIVYSVLGGENQITADSICRAITIGGWLQSNTLRLFTDTGMDHFGKCERIIIEMLKRAKDGQAWRREMQQAVSKRNFNAEIFNRTIRALESNDILRCRTITTAAGRERTMLEYLGNR